MNQLGASFAMRELAERLVVFEAAETISAADAVATCRVCEKLRRPLSTFTGTAGFSSLLTRSLTLAKREAPALSAVQVNSDGSMTGMEGEAVEASVVLIAHLLGLLTTFIGETLTMRLLHDVWPEFSGSNLSSQGEEFYESAQ